MPYDLKTRSGIVLRNIPDDMSPDAPELKALVQQQLAARKPTTPPAAITAADPGEIARMTTADMSGPAKILANLGAGVDSLWQGAQQLGAKVGLGSGVNDEELKDSRERREALAGQTTGGGLMQFAGEAVPTMLLPFGAAARGVGATLKGAGRLSQALSATRASKLAGTAAEAVGKGTTRAVVDSAATGAATGALAPVTSDESRLGNVALGGAFGGAVPAAGRVLGAGYGALTKAGAKDRAALVAQEASGRDPSAVRRLRQYVNDSPEIPLSSAAAAQSPGLARLEAGARARNGAEFFDLDQAQAQAVFDKVMRHTEDSGQLATRQADRAAEWRSNWQTAETVADPKIFAARMQQFVPALDTALRSPEAMNPAVRNVVQVIRDEIANLGDDFSPAHLQQIRANLNERGKSIPTNAYQGAPRDSAAVESLIDEADSILNQTTHDAWDAVKGGYADASRLVDQSKASGRVRESFIDPDTGRVRGTAADPRGDVPLITEAGLGRALDRSRAPDGSNLLSEEAGRGLNQTLDALRRQGITQRVKRSATAGGGANTASDLFAAGVADRLPGGSKVRGAFEAWRTLANGKRDAALLDALRNPQAMADLLTTPARAVGDFSSRDEALLRFLRATTSTAAANSTH